LWWLNIPRADLHGWRRLPNVPADYFSCQGFDGQLVAVVPSKDLVVVRLSREEGYMDPNLLLAPILKALPDSIQSLNF
jgi:CubicO group peptidase (beta-lactamase class C family)